MFFRFEIPVPGLVEPRYRGIVEVKLRHDSRNALADLKGFELDSVESLGILRRIASPTMTLLPRRTTSPRFHQDKPSPDRLVGRVVATIHPQPLCVPAVSLYRVVQIPLNTRCEELDDKQRRDSNMTSGWNCAQILITPPKAC